MALFQHLSHCRQHRHDGVFYRIRCTYSFYCTILPVVGGLCSHILSQIFSVDSNGTHAMSPTQASPQDASSEALTVMFDGACPLCRREIALYQSLAPLQTVSWLDVSKDTTGLSQTDRARYMARFHVQLQDGRIVSGAAAFVALWLVMPGWRWLGRVGRLPGVTLVLELAYRGFLHLRPYLQRWARIAEPTNRR